MKTFQNSALKIFWVSLVLAVLTAVVYWPVCQHEFITFDDDIYVTENYLVLQGLSVEGIAWAFQTTAGGNWHPLTWLSHMLDVEMFGAKAGAHHVSNLFLHILNTILVFLFLRKITGATWRSAFVAALFALHPLHVESVAWVAERKDLLSALFGLSAMWFYVRYVWARQERTSATRNYIGSLVFFALGLMSKPMLVTLPCVLLLLDYWPLRRLQFKGASSKHPPEKTPATAQPPVSLPRLLLEKVPFFALTILFSAITVFAQRSAGAMASLEQMTFLHRAGNALVAYAAYLGKMFWPRDLAILYPIQIWPAWKIAVAGLILLVLCGLVLKWATRRPYLLFGWLWFLGILVPVIGLVHVGSQAMADRYTYLPYIGLFIMVSWGAFDLLKSRKLSAVLAIVLVGCCAVLTRGQLAHWRNSETLYRHTLSKTTRNVLILDNLASELISQGRIDEAIVLLEEALALNPNLPETLSNLGSALERKGRADEALRLYQRAIEIKPGKAEAQNNIGFLLLMDGRLEKAAEHFLIALQARPQFPEAHYNLGNVYFMQGNIAEALPHYEAAVRYRPNYAEARSNLGYTLMKLGKAEAALPHLQTAVRLKPGYAQAHNNLAEVLLRRGKYVEGEAHARRAVALQPTSAAFQNVLGLALGAQLKWEEAEKIFSSALELNPAVAEIYFNRANSHLAQNHWAEAKADYSAALDLQPQQPDAEMKLAMLLSREGDSAGAVAHLRKALEMRPDSQTVINNLAWILATDSHAEVRNGEEALRLARRAVEMKGENLYTLDTLAAAHAELGQFDAAVAAAKKASALVAKSQPNSSLSKEIDARLESYKKQTPWRER